MVALQKPLQPSVLFPHLDRDNDRKGLIKDSTEKMINDTFTCIR